MATIRRNLSLQQRALLVEGLENQPALMVNLSGCTASESMTKFQLEALWDDLGRTISREPIGLAVDGKSLKCRWKNWKSRVKAKALQLKKDVNEPQGSRKGNSPPELTHLEKRLLLAMGDYEEECLTSICEAHETHEQVPVEMVPHVFETGHVVHASALKVEPLSMDEFVEEPVEGHSISASSEVMSSSSIQTSSTSAEEVPHWAQPDILMQCQARDCAFVPASPSPQNIKKLRIREEDPSLPLLNEVAQQQRNMMENIEGAVRDQVAAIREQSHVIQETSREHTAAIREQSEVLRQTNTILKEMMSVLFKNGSK